MMEPVNKDVKEAVLNADKFLSVTLAQEKLSPPAEKERRTLAEKFKNLITQLGLQSEQPGGVKPPPRPPKGGIPIPAPVPNTDEGGEELYDDLAAVADDDQEYSPMAPGGEESAADIGGENYEVMAADSETPQDEGEDYVAMEDDTTPVEQEDYEEPGQAEEGTKQDSTPDNEDYEMPGAEDSMDYEVAVGSEKNPADSLYEGVETANESSVDGLTSKQRSGTMIFENLTKDTKPENIEGVIKKGFLNKHRKDGKVYLGSRWQKRYCVVRNHVLYYFKDKKSARQQGYILLPGYQAAVANKKGREFTLTHPEGHRSYQFESNSKKETEEWIAAIQKAANAPMSESNNVHLHELRDKQASGDEDSLHYEDTGPRKNSPMEEQEEPIEDEGEVYDDTNEDLYEVVGSVQSPTPTQQSSPQLPEYEITGPTSVVAPKPVEPIIEEDYELPEQSSPAPALPPPRPVKSKSLPPQDDSPPIVPPPRSSKPQPPPPTPPASAPPVQDKDADDLPPPPPPGEIELEDYEPLETFQEDQVPAPVLPPVPAAVPVRPPKRKVSPPSNDALPPKPQENVPVRPQRPGPKPVTPARADETPASAVEEETNCINYANVYQALWDCASNEKDELGFRRGDLIYIYEKPHADWWIGSLFKPQGYSVGLVPKDYVMEAYELSAY